MCLFIVCETMFTVGESRAISHAIYIEKASTTSGWKSSLAKICHRKSSGDSSAGGSKKTTARQKEHRLAERRQRRQHKDHKHVQRQRQDTTITL